MRYSGISYDSYIEDLFNEFSHPDHENSPCQGIENVSIFVNKKRWKKRKKHNVFEYAQQPPIAFRLSKLSKPNEKGLNTRPSSMPELSKCTRPIPHRNRSGHGNDTKHNKFKQSHFQSKFIANVFSEHRFDNWFLNPNYPSQTKWKIYRCQLGAVEDSCCCSCNSDAMFEVMKGLYDCYKAKNCDGCDCVLCGYKTKEERKIGELRKSAVSAAREKVLEGKTPEEKEFILKEMAKTRQPLPSGKTPSDKALIEKLRKELGLPPSPKTASEKAKMRKAEEAGIITPLEGKTPEEKEKILQAQADMGLSLPEGRTDSEKALIDKVKAKKKRAMTTALLTPLTGKTPEEQEKILRGRALKGLPLPEPQTPSEKKLIAKVRADLGLPKEPTTKSLREKYDQAAKAGLLQPLEGKTPEEKEKTLRGLRSLGIPLPEGRTPSEKALVAKVKASPKSIVTPSERFRRAKAEGLITPLTGKTPEQKEKIIKGLAMKGLPLPEATTASEKKLIDKVRADLGLPKEPTTKSLKDKYEQAAKAGLLQPLEGMTPEEKEKTLRGLRSLGIPLPEGRTTSEKALVAKVKASPKSIVTPSERFRRAKAEGLITPLAGKTPEQKEKIIKGLAMKGLPLPEATTASEKKLIDKVRADLGLPKEPTTKSLKDKYEQAAKAGLLQPLEGMTPEEKEKTLRGLRSLGIPLPEGRTPSEKALVAMVKASPKSIVTPSERLRRAKAEGLMTPLAGKTPEQKEKIIKGLAMKGLPLPEATTASEKKLIDKVRADLGLPKEPTTKSLKDKFEKAAKAGLLQPLEGMTPEEKEKTLKGLHDMGIPLPEGRTPSEKALVAKVKSTPRAGSIKTAGMMTPLAGKTPDQKENILRKRAMKGIPLPEAVTPSEKNLIEKVRNDLGLPMEPTTKSLREKHEQAAKAGLLEPLEGKTPAQKEALLKGLRNMGIPLPAGRTPSEKALVAKVLATPRSLVAPSEQLRRAQREGLMTPLAGKTPAQKEKILKGLAMKGIPLPEGKSPSEKKLIEKVRDDLGIPKEPDTKSMKEKYDQAAKAGLLQPLMGKTPQEKEKILQDLQDFGIPLPEGRTPSEKALVAKIKAAAPPAGSIKTAGVMTPLTGKSPAHKEKVLRARAMKGIPLPEGVTPSEKKIIDKVRADLGLPKEPTTKSLRDKHEQAAKLGLLEPLEGKTAAQKEAQLKGLRDMGIPLPEGRTPSEKALIAKVKGTPRSLVAPSEQMRRAKAEGLLTPLTGKTPAQKEKILKGLAMKGIPLPEGKSPSEKKLIDKVRDDLGIPKEPDTKSMKEKYDQAAKAGLLQPLMGKSPEEKEKILQGLQDIGIPLPEGRTPSEKALVAKIKAAAPPAGSIKTAGVMTPLTGKSPAHKEKVLRARAMKGIPLPEGVTPSEKKIIDKVRADLGLPKEPTTKSLRDKHEQAAKLGLLEPLEGKTAAQKEAQLKGLRDMGIPLPEGRTPSEKALIAKVKGAPRSLVAPSEQMRRAKAEGLLTPLTGKTPAQKEKILKGLAMKGIPLPEGKSPSEKKLIDKVRDDLGIPKEPDTKSMKEKYDQAAKAGLLQPLMGKSPEEKEKILQGLQDFGIPLPEGRTPSEKALVAKIKAAAPPAGSIKTAGIMTPLTGKSPAHKEKVLRARAMKGIPLPEGVTPSEKKIIDKVRADLGLPKEPTTKSLRDKHEQAAKLGLLEPLEGKTAAQKEAQLKGLRDMGIPLPEGRTPSEKALIAKVKGAPRSLVAPSEQMRRAKAEGLLTPLTGKTPAQKEKILKGLAMKGIPLPEGKSPSEKKLIDKVRDDLGIPKEPDTKSMKEKYDQAAKAGLLQPLMGKSPEEKEKILQGLQDFGIPLPEGRTPSEKALVAKIKAAAPPAGSIKTAGVMTPLTGKSPAHKEKVLRARAMKGIPLPEGVTPSEKKIIDKVRADLGLPKEPTTKSLRDKHEQAAKLGLLEPLEGKTAAQKEAQLKGLRDMGIPLPEGRTPSEKALIAKVKGAPRSLVAPSEQMRRAKAEGLLTPLSGKTPAQKEKILKGLAMKGLPLPEGKSPSEKKLIDKVRDDLGLPKEPDSKSMRDKYEKAAKAGLLQPLMGKSPEEKEKILQGLQDFGIPLPEGRTPSEKALVGKVRQRSKAKKPEPSITTEKMRKAKADGLFTPLKGKTPEQKEKILEGLAEAGLPLPEGKTPSDKALIEKVKKDFGIPERTPSEKFRRAQETGLLTPLEGKTNAQKEKILRGRAAAGLPLPRAKTPSERALIKRIKDETGYKTPSQSKRLRAAEAAGLITPLEGKSPSMKEKILQGMKAAGIPMPKGETPSDRKLIRKFVSKPIKSVMELEGVPSEKVRAAKAAGLLTPLEGKTPAEKEKIIKGLAEAGLPLPEGKTKSEKSMISKIRARIPPEGKTPSEKSIIGKAKAAGLFTPITGKAPAEKERILKGLAEAGLPLPEGKTASEKDLVKKIRAEAGLPLEATPSEKKGKIRKKAKKVGVSASKKAAGIDAEEFEDIIKTTKCDRGCGCDRKKIRFKHSYVKIRVTSPDISSFCDCPGDCFPQVRSGAFIDNDGIKVTVGSAVGIPSYSMIGINQVMPDAIVSNIEVSKRQTNYNNNINVLGKTEDKLSVFESSLNNYSNKANDNFNIMSSDISYSTKSYNTQSENNFIHSGIANYQSRTSSKDLNARSASSFDTILIIRNDMSLSTSTSNSMDTISLTSVMNSSITSSSAHYSGYQSTNDLLSMNSIDEPTTSDDFIDHPAIRERNVFRNIGAAEKFTILRMSQLEDNFGSKKIKKTMKEPDTDDPIVLFNDLPSKLDVSKMMLKIMSKKLFAGASSIFIVVPKSEDEEKQSSNNCVASLTSMRSSGCCFKANTASLVDPDISQLSSRHHITRTNEIAEMLQQAARSVGTDTTAERSCCSCNEHYTVNRTSRRSTPLFVTGKCFSWFRCTKSTESSANDIVQCVDPSLSPVPPCLRDRSQQQQTSEPPSVSGCSPDVVKRNRTALVQKPAIESMRQEGRTVPKKTGIAWFRSGLRKESASSSVPECDIPLCFDLGSSPATSHDSRPHGRSQQQQTPASPAPGLCLSDFEVTGNPSVKVGKSYSWFHKPGTRQAFASCDIPLSCDYRFCPALPNLSHHHGRGKQNHNKPNPQDYSKVTRNPTAEVGKSYSSFHLPGNRKANCDMPQFCPSPNHSCQQGRVQHIHRKKYHTDDLEVTRNPSAKVHKPCIRSTRHKGETAEKSTGSRIRLPARCAPCDTPPTCKPRDNGLSRHRQPLVKRNRPDTVQKPSIRQDCEPTPKIAGVLKWLSWTRLQSQRKKSAPSIPTCNVPQCLASSFSPALPYHPRHLGRDQQNQTSTSAPCDSPPGDLRVKTRTAKVQRPSIASLYHQDESTHKICGVNLSWSLFPRLTSTRETSAPSMTPRHVPQCLDSSSSPGYPGHNSCTLLNQTSATPSDTTYSGCHSCNQQNQTSATPSDTSYPGCHSCNQQNQTSATPSLCAHPSVDSKVKRRRSGMRISWSRLPSKRKKSVPPIPTCRLPRYHDSSTSPVPPDNPRHHDYNQQGQSSATHSCPDVSEGMRTRTAKVQKPSIESLYHEGQTTNKITGVTVSWSLLPSKHNTYEPSITRGGLLQCSGLHARIERTQTPESLCVFKEMRNLSVKEQKSFIEIIRQEGGSHHTNAGLVSGWFLLPCTLTASVKNSNRLQDTQNSITKKTNTVTLSDSNPEPGSQRTGEHLFQTQNVFATKQNDPRETWCTFRKQILMQTELAKETDKLPDPIDQKPAILANEITPVQEKLTSIKKVDQKRDKLMSPFEFESSKEPKSPKIKRESKEDKPNTITLPDSKLATGGKLATGKIPQSKGKFLIKQKDFQTICRPCPKQDHMPHPELTKEIVKLPEPIDQQLDKTAKELTLVQQKLASVKTFEQKRDKPMSPKNSKGTQTNGNSTEDKQKPNTETLTDSIPEPGGQLTFEKIAQPQQGSLTKENVPREICCPFRKQKLISQPELTKEVVKLPDSLEPQPHPIEQQPEKLANEIKPVQQKLASSKTVEQNREDKAVSLKEINENSFGKMTKLFVDMRKTIMSRINEILNILTGLKGSDNPKDPSTIELKNAKTNKEKGREVVCECKEDKSMRTKGLNSPGTRKKKKRDLVCECEDGNLEKSIKQKENVSCMCEKHEPKQNHATEQLPIPRRKRYPPRLPPILLGLPPVETPEGYLYEGIGPCCKCLDTGVRRRLRSELTHSTSGFKARKKSKLQKSQAVDNIELDFGDAIRYFASMNPELFQQLIQEELDSQRRAEEIKRIEEIKLPEQIEKARKKSNKKKEAKKGKVDKISLIDKFPISDESDSDYPRGLKFSFACKDGPTAIAGVDCTKINRSRSTKSSIKTWCAKNLLCT